MKVITETLLFVIIVLFASAVDGALVMEAMRCTAKRHRPAGLATPTAGLHH
jgi:hypothetical protein